MTFINDANTGAIQQFDFSLNLLRAILWQYTEATNLQGILNAKQTWYNTNNEQFWENWYTDVFDLATANEFGLLVWSIILGLPLYTNYGPTPPIFGFDHQTNINFDNGIFGDSNSFNLPTETKRIALQLRYFQLTSAGTVPEINRMLKFVFGSRGTAFLLDNHNMTQTYIFNFPVTFDLQYLFNHYDLLPRPAGVMSNYIDTTLAYWGFAVGDFNFDNGIFGA